MAASGGGPGRTKKIFAGGFVIASVGIALFWIGGGRSSDSYFACSDTMVRFMRYLDPETAHGTTIAMMKMGLFHPVDASKRDRLRVHLWGKDVPCCVGMAAGFDKQGEVMSPLFDIGFGFVEIGGVTPKPQIGNPKPRMFRLPKDRALINRFGLNSDGADVVRRRVALWRQRRQSDAGGLVGVNIAKNTGSDSALEDYKNGARKFCPDVDFVVLNMSCPNVGWTSKLGKSTDVIEEIVFEVRKILEEEKMKTGRSPALLIKLGPDMSVEERRVMASLALRTGVDGIVVSNTSKTRPLSLQSDPSLVAQKGGLSGAPIKDMATESIRDIYRVTRGRIPLVGCGGIGSAEDAYERIRSGANLVQFYSALVYEGPSLVPRMKQGLEELLLRDGFDSVESAVGVDVREE